MAPRLVVVGPPGAGKTTVGQTVATSLAVSFADTDHLIEDRAGKPIPEIFFDEGEAHFRALERETIATALETFDGVLALGGGAILDPGTREALRPHAVVFLSVELPDAVKRVGLGSGRPLLSVNPRATLKFLMEERRPLYESVATHTVKTDARSPAEIAAEIVSFF